MDIKLELETGVEKTITLPEELFLDQLMNMDLTILTDFDKAPIEKKLQWFVKFFKIIGVDHRWTIKEFITHQDHLMQWIQRLFEGFQTSS